MRLPLNRLIRKVTGYRLGYNIQRDYPGRWTTPVVVIVYVALAVFLALMNIPLTAYDIVQEYTYTPNATVPPLPFSYLIPSFLKSPLPDFSPQTLHVGDVLHLYDSTEEYTITSANGADSFLFYNNPLTSCDVQNVTMQTDWRDGYALLLMSADISCWFPVRFSLHWEPKTLDYFATDMLDLLGICWPSVNGSDIIDSCHEQPIYRKPYNVTELMVRAQAYCSGSSPELAWTPRSMQDHLPCNSDPISFVTFHETLNVSAPDLSPNDRFTFLPNQPRISDCIQFQQKECASIYQITRGNALQDVYHSLRRDLGIHSPNQIWASPSMFNETIRAIPQNLSFLPVPPPFAWQANKLRANYSLFPWDMEHDTSVKTPKIFYSCWTYHRKSLGSAITNVFVATFTMLAATWKVFSFVAGLVISKEDPMLESDTVRELREELATVRQLQEEMQRVMRRQEPRYRLSLADMGDRTLTESLLSSIDQDSKEEAWSGHRDGYFELV